MVDKLDDFHRISILRPCMHSVSFESCRWIAAHYSDGAARAPDGDAQLPVERSGARRDGALLDVGGGPGEQPHLPPRVLPHQQEAGIC